MLVACGSAAPPVPPPLALDADAHGARVQYGAVQGYLARPIEPAREHRIEVWRFSETDPEVQAAARVRASEGVRVFVVSGPHDIGAVTRYLGGLTPRGLDTNVCLGACTGAP